MYHFKINRKRRLIATIAISGGFFIAELVVGYRTKSLALIADAFHYENPSAYIPTLWLESRPDLEDPILILIMGCIGLGLNMIVLSFLHDTEPHLHEHTQETRHHDEDHTHTGDLNMLGVLLHVLTDALNNLSVIIAALIIWKSPSDNRFYADPAIGIFIALTITLSAVPLCRRAGQILMESAPAGLDVEFVRGEMLKVPGVQEVSNVFVWQLDQTTSLATAHITITENSVRSFASTADAIGLTLLPYGIRSVALQPATTQRRPHHEAQEGIKVS
ncbi:cation diffusion facilitator family transporter [Colletotrichum scovillei]|uniref:cation diffusion facilitator family transporter n=1 Tax=Colletotrichum scovillei TaxID=1209932 RepID=UPI0015C333A8|nr:cation diffusion facilitator family transporter [Colletotrichum scovillei]KAF4778316.1 cation diffusion facilitator family transporter [Colletotrichum scovillei]